MPAASLRLPPIDLRGENLSHLKWILDCLEPGEMVEIDERRFQSLFGLPGPAAFEGAEELARSKGCRFIYHSALKTATFQRLSSARRILREQLSGAQKQ